MDIHVLSKEELLQFKRELLEEIKKLIGEGRSQGDQREWLRSAEVRQMLGISPGTLQNLRVNGTLPYRKIGGTMYYDRRDIKRMMEGGAANG